MPKLTLQKNKNGILCMALHSGFKDKDIAKSIQGREWEPNSKAWLYPIRPEKLQELCKAFPGVVVTPEVTRAVAEVEIREVTAARIKVAGWQGVKVTEPMPLRTKPFAHQAQGYQVACELLGVFQH